MDLTASGHYQWWIIGNTVMNLHVRKEENFFGP
jgi:hypothetical protein